MSTEIPAQAASRSFFTRFALIWMNLASEPFVALYTLLLFILRKDLSATTLQITVFATLQPVIAVFSFYWSSNLLRQRTKLLSNLMGAWVLGRLPFLCLPFIDNVWFLIFAAGLYQLFERAGIPAMMEILKLNVTKDRREKLYSRVFVLKFIESIILGVFVGKLLDIHPGTWKIFFFIAALLSISSIFIQMRIPLPTNLKPDENIPPITTNRLLQPIKDCIHLMRSRPDFAHFQWGFMIGGFGLMLMKPASILFYVDHLALSHDQVTMARYIWMGIGVVASSFLWRRALNAIPNHRFTAIIIFGFSFFPLFLLLAQWNQFWVNIAFLFYGIAQAGSHLIWTLSGTLFANNEDSSKFTGVNIFMVGLRGLIGPVLGGILCGLIGPVPVLLTGAIICIGGTIYMTLTKSMYEKKRSAQIKLT
jgi:predicted MFS family arabinose efflux permease